MKKVKEDIIIFYPIGFRGSVAVVSVDEPPDGG
jgi:hypothetical protein